MLYHARPALAAWFAPFPFVYNLFDIGPSGVDLFFVLSGFLITSILLGTKGGSPRSYFWSFYARRILRIFPLYLLAVAAFFQVSLPFLQRHGLSLNARSSEQIWYWMYLVNWHDAAGHMIDPVGHFWSLGVEEQFYMLWPAVVFFCAVRYFPALCIFIGTLSLALRFELSTSHLIAPELLSEFIHRATVTRLDTLAVGALIAIVVRNRDWTWRVRRQIKFIAPVAFAVFLAMFMAAEKGKPFLLETLGYLITAIAYGCVVFVCVTDQGSNHLVCRVARWRPLQSFGRYSYAIYVLHLLVIFCVQNLIAFFVYPLLRQVNAVTPIPPILVALFGMGAGLSMSYIAAFISWHLFEKHFIRLKKYFPYQVGLLATSECETAAMAKIAGAD